MLGLATKFNNRLLFSVAFISALGGYLFGFDFAVIAGALPFLKEQFSFNEYWDGFATASLAFGCVLGCLIAGRVADRQGRRPGLLLAAFMFFISSIAMALATDKVFFVSCRFLAGVGVGMASTLSPLYIAEISPPASRGKMVAINQLTVVIGILVTNVVNYYLSNEGPDAWRWMVGLGAVPAAIFFAGAWWLPESPRWLLTQGKKEKAEITLSRIGGKAYADEVISSVISVKEVKERVSYAQLLTKAVMPALFIGIGLAVFQQLCGINVVFNFTTTIFESIGFSQADQLKQTVFIGLVNLIFTVLAMWQVDKIGRKPLLMFGALGLAVFYILSALLLQQKSAYASLTLLASIGVYAMTLAPVTWIMISEIFPNRIRGLAVSVSVVALWLSYALLVFTFPIMAKQMGTYVPFYIYACICLLGFLFIKFKVKETKGLSLEEIENKSS